MTTKNLAVAENAELIAAFLRQYPELPEPTHYEIQYGASVRWLIWNDGPVEQKRRAQEVVRFLPCIASKRIDDDGNDDWMRFFGSVDGVDWEVVCQREAVCKRIVTGTETVTRTVPDPDVAAPTIEVTETVETVEWDCDPLLAGGDTR